MKFIRIDKSVLSTKLSFQNVLDDPTNKVIGWKIRYLNSSNIVDPIDIVKLEFIEVEEGPTTASSYQFEIIAGEILVCETMPGGYTTLGDSSFSLNDLHSNLPLSSIGFDFCYISVDELSYAISLSDINHFHISLMSIDFLSSAIGEVYNINDYTFKIECVKSSTFINSTGIHQIVPLSGSYTATPLVLIPMPCPPVWRPGYSNGISHRVAQPVTNKKYLEKLSKKIETIDKTKKK